MLNPNELKPEIVKDRLANAVNVSGAMDNCFFHSYAAYLLSNNLPLPTDLFTPNPENKDSPAEKLKDIFKEPKDLEIFNAYRQQKYPGSEPSEMLVEKSLVLGVLFREWFAKNLAENQQHKQQLFDNNDNSKVSFLKLIENYRELGRDVVMSDDRMAPIFESNRAFFDKLAHIPQPNETENFRDYWENQGYQNYCEYVAKPGVKLSITDVEPVLKMQNVPYTLYSKHSGGVVTHNEGDTTQPHFDLAISGQAGHYYLLKDSKTEASLNEFQASMEQYRLDREAVVKMPGTPAEKLAACEEMPSPLVGAMCYQSQIGEDPIELLIRKSAEMKSSVAQEHLNNADENMGQNKHHPDHASQPLTAKENRVLEATTAAQSTTVKYQHYKQGMKDLILQSRNTPNLPNLVSLKDIDKAQALEGECDEDFAKRLQESEFKGAGLK